MTSTAAPAATPPRRKLHGLRGAGVLLCLLTPLAGSPAAAQDAEDKSKVVLGQPVDAAKDSLLRARLDSLRAARAAASGAGTAAGLLGRPADPTSVVPPAPRTVRLLGRPIELVDDPFLGRAGEPEVTTRVEPSAGEAGGGGETGPRVLGRPAEPAAAPAEAPEPSDATTSVLGQPASPRPEVLGQPALLGEPAEPEREPVEPEIVSAPEWYDRGRGPLVGSPIPALEPGPALDPARGSEAGEASVAYELLGRPAGEAFRAAQLRYPRVRGAHARKESVLRELFAERGLPYPAEAIYLRAFKRERVLELWVRAPGQGTFELLKSYPTCNSSGRLGPKQQMGDLQVPEGFYHISGFNPRSEYYLSLRVSYPNAADRARGQVDSLGGDIYIHGDCVTVGCVAITNDQIEEIYWAAVEAKAAGQQRIPLHIFPARLHAAGVDWLRGNFGDDPARLRFWDTLRPAYEFFERERRLPLVTVDGDGAYDVRS